MRQALVACVKAYRLLASPWLGAACRFEPTCSVYAIEALQVHGSLRGSGLAAWRIARCAPWCEGGHDPVPNPAPNLSPKAGSATRAQQLFSRLIPQQAGQDCQTAHPSADSTPRYADRHIPSKAS